MKRFFGIGASATTVRRVLKAEGLGRRRVVKARPKPVERRFERAEPNQLWQSDLFTFLLRRHERLYVAAFLDDHSRYLVSLALAHHQRSALVLEALARGIAEYGAPREILTDQGRQYTAWRGSTEFEAELRRHGIEHVKSRPHHPQTCGKIERFWKTMWEEFLSRTVFADYEDCQRRVLLFVQHYNFQRPHQALDGLTPADRFFRSATPVREAIEATVATNALRLAREQQPRKPFYLVGRLGDRDLSISTSGGAVKVRVGDEETMIPLEKESDHEDAPSSTRGRAQASQAPVPANTEVAGPLERARGDGAQPLPDGVVGAVGRDTSDGGDRASEDLARDVLPARDESCASDARGPEHALLGSLGPGGGVIGGERPDCATDETSRATRAREAAPAATAAPDAQGDRPAGEAGASGPVVEDAPAAAHVWTELLYELDGESAAERRAELDAAWRAVALRWERKLCGATAPQEINDESTATELHTEPGGTAGGDAAAGCDRGSARGVEDGLGGGALARAIAQSLPDDLASRSVRVGGGDLDQVGRPTEPAEGDREAASPTQALAERERTAAEAGRLDAATADCGGGTPPRSDPADSTPDTDSQERRRAP
jgi:transposase InsO family protein